jgi:hypothetical protein
MLGGGGGGGRKVDCRKETTKKTKTLFKLIVRYINKLSLK